MDSLHVGLIVGGVFLVTSVLASKVSAKLGMPALVLFILVGMLAGSDGLGGLPFEDFAITKTLGMTLLGFILFAGGLETHWSHIKPTLLRGLSLSTIGVVISCGAVGAFAHFVLKVPAAEAMLLGGILASTDAAAIFGSLRGGGLKLKHGLGPLLEIESGTNDPMAVFLTVVLTKMAANPGVSFVTFLPSLLIQMPIGVAVGWMMGRATQWLINWIRLEFDGLYSVITIAACGLTLGIAPVLGGNEFIAVYAAGVTLGSGVFIHKASLTRFHDGLAWLFQIIVFLALGLLVFPNHLLKMIGPGLLFALFLVLVARPASVYVSLLFSGLNSKSKFFVSWAGLKGAFPIILATYPVLAGLPNGEYIFNLVFFAVFVSVLIQGVFMRRIGKALGVFEPDITDEDLEVSEGNTFLEIDVTEGSALVDKRIFELGLPATAYVILIRRGQKSISPRGQTTVRAGDQLVITSRRNDFDELRMLLSKSAA